MTRTGRLPRVSTLACAAILAAAPAFAVEIFPRGNGSFEIVQELGINYTQDARVADAKRYCEARGERFQSLVDDNSLSFTCVRR